MVSKLLAGLAASALVAAPVAAAPAASPASQLSIAKTARAGTSVKKGEHLAGGAILPAILALAVVAGGIYLVVDDNDDDSDSN